MPIVKEVSKPRTPISEGVHQAICYGVIDCGTQPPMPGSQFQTDPTRKVMLMFEFPDERIQLERDGRQVDLPRACSQEFTSSLHKKAKLRSFLTSWRGKQFTEDQLKGFDLRDVLGANCMINIVHNGRGYETFSSIMPIPKGMVKRQAENELVIYDIEEEVPASLPEWIRKKIMRSEEKSGVLSECPSAAHDPQQNEDDDIPF